MDLPSLAHDYSDARINGFTVGPRREITLDVSVMSWNGSKGEHRQRVQIRFGAINNLNEVAAFFRSRHQDHSELAFVRYSKTRVSKPGHLFVDVAFERTDATVCISCGSLAVADVEAGAGST